MKFHEKLSTWRILGFATVCSLLALQVQTCSAGVKQGEPCTPGLTACETQYCDKNTGTCECMKVKDGQTGRFVYQDFHQDLQLCLSAVGQTCLVDSNTDDKRLPPLTCIPEAQCRRSSNSQGNLGVCVCKPEHTLDFTRKKCISNAEMRAPKVPNSMDQRKPEEWTGNAGGKTVQSCSIVVVISTCFVILSLTGMFPLR